MRDQAESIYRAEAFLKHRPFAKDKMTWFEAALYLTRLSESVWWRERSRVSALLITPCFQRTQNADKLFAYGHVVYARRRHIGQIEYPHRRIKIAQSVLAHELAHILSGHTAWTGAEDAHGPVFAGWDFEITSHHYGKEAGTKLLANFVREGVRFLLP